MAKLPSEQFISSKVNTYFDIHRLFMQIHTVFLIPYSWWYHEISKTLKAFPLAIHPRDEMWQTLFEHDLFEESSIGISMKCRNTLSSPASNWSESFLAEFMGLQALDFITSTKKPKFYNLDRCISNSWGLFFGKTRLCFFKLCSSYAWMFQYFSRTVR